MASLAYGQRAEFKLDASKRSVHQKAKSQRRVSLVIRELLESTDLSLGDGRLFADFVECEVSL
jgi:hypothetical protein